jgi:hypothetical protein
MFSTFYSTFHCPFCNNTYFILSSKNTYTGGYGITKGISFGSCVDYLYDNDNQFPSNCNNPCNIISFLYSVKKSLHPNTLYIDPFDYTYLYVKKLKELSGQPFQIVYDSYKNSSFIQFINHLSINSRHLLQ